jgi:diguanylate cyclase (GGDEF)-like protein
MTTPSRNTRVLVIDDSPEIHGDFARILAGRPAAAGGAGELARLRAAVLGKVPGTAADGGQTFAVDGAFQGQEGLEKVRAAVAANAPYAAAFVDMRMPPGWDGLRTLQELWRVDPDLQLVVCTAYTDTPAEELEKIAGDTDRLLVLKKPFDAIEVRRLAATLVSKWNLARAAAVKVNDLEYLVRERTADLELARRKDELRLEELEQAVERRTAALRKAATHDELTGLPNRLLFHDRLSQALEQAARDPNFRVAVLFIDFDRFKVVNDSLGHETGDILLRSIAERLSAALRATDTVTLCQPSASTAARLGGDEFCILLTGLKRHEDACAVADRILQDLERPHEIGGREVHSSASIGIAVNQTGRERAEEMVRDADNAMYRAKATGKGRYVMFDAAMHEEAMVRLTIENDLRRTIDRNQLRTYYQPVVSLVTGEVTGAEALVRWEHPDRGRVSPAEFIAIAEETGFIDKLGLWVLEDACGTLARWRQAMPAAGHLRMNVNVSFRQLQDPRFPDHVAAVLGMTGLPPQLLTLEITETILVNATRTTQQLLARLRAMGVHIFLDDFGTGYSSLNVLNSVPLDGLKIDRSFVLDASGRRRYAAVIHAIMNLVHDLGMDGVAEGVESIEHVALLQSLGCNKGQGYLFSPPMAAAEMEEMIRRSARPWLMADQPAA